jgi:triosephosphate isomerase
MNKNLASALALAKALKAEVGACTEVDIGVFPPYLYLPAVVDALRGTHIVVGAQNLHSEPEGAFTGEVSGPMIRDVGATHVLIGHSERRQYFGETDEDVNAKLKAALACGLKPIVCVGETLAQRKAGATEDVVGAQVTAAIRGLTPDAVRSVVVAYEPVWAIGTGVTATPQQAQEAHAFIRSVLASEVADGVANDVRIQYGGSVKPGAAADLLAQPDIDGALVGGASLDPASFIAIVRAKDYD